MHGGAFQKKHHPKTQLPAEINGGTLWKTKEREFSLSLSLIFVFLSPIVRPKPIKMHYLDGVFWMKKSTTHMTR